MPNTVIAIKKSATPAAVPTSLANGELAINFADGIIYYKNVSGGIASISGGYSFGTVNAGGTLLVSDTAGDVLDIRAGQNIIITGDAINDRMTINADLTAANSWANAVGVAANAYALSIAGGGSVNVSTVGPTNNTNGSLWWNTDLGRLFIWYTDGDSNQWVEASPSSGSIDVELLQSYTNVASDLAKLAFNQSNSAYTQANTKLANTSNTFFAGNFYIPDGFTLGIGSTDSIAPLTISKSGVSSVTLAGALIDADGTANSYLQAAIRNANTGAGVSTDWIATTDDGTDTTNFIDLVINGSGFSSPSWTINGRRDGYLYTVDSNLSIGSANSTSRTKFINFFVGGTLSSNEAMRIQDSSAGPNVGIGTTTPASKLDVNGLIRDSKGDVRDIPLNTQVSTYALTLSDTGKIISTNTNVFVPNGIFSSGHTISVFNDSATTISIIANGSVTLRLAGGANSANKRLAQNGVATIICVAANNFVVSGAGLS